MPKGISLHIGLNRVDPAHYQGWDGELTACEFDAKDMRTIAQKQKFASSRLLLSAEATAGAVIQAIIDAAKECRKGDLFWITYSGHGGQVPDTNHDEKTLRTGLRDNLDETWVLYDRQLVDDELYVLWGKFRQGVRILVFSDSCHSGTVVKAPASFLSAAAAGAVPSGPAIRWLPLAQSERVYRANRQLYDAIQRDNPTAERTRVRGTVLLISGCMDNQFSMDGPRNGAFTGALRKVWNNGRFQGGYHAFRNAIAARLPASQTPNYLKIGAGNAAFENQNPCTL